MEQRKFPRIKIRNFISFVEYNKDGQIESHNPGIALDVSQGGILLETRDKLDTQCIHLIYTSNDSKLIEIKAKVVYSLPAGDEKFNNGLSLQGKPDENLQFVTNLIQAYHFRKKSQNRKIFL